MINDERDKPPTISHDDFEELLRAMVDVLNMAPDSDAAIRLTRVYENIYRKGDSKKPLRPNTEVWRADPEVRVRNLPLTLLSDDLEELLYATMFVRKTAPGSDAAIGLTRVYENVYWRGMLTEKQQARRAILIDKPQLTADERAELNTMRLRYPPNLAPRW